MDDAGRTALHYAARCKEQNVDLLLRRGAQYITIDKDGDTPLDRALRSSSTGCVSLLRQVGATCKEARKKRLARIEKRIVQMERWRRKQLREVRQDEDRFYENLEGLFKNFDQ